LSSAKDASFCGAGFELAFSPEQVVAAARIGVVLEPGPIAAAAGRSARTARPTRLARSIDRRYAGSMSDVEFPDLGEDPAREAVVSIVERVDA
jgi:hypothetical protein